jgi:hypothetical protein
MLAAEQTDQDRTRGGIAEMLEDLDRRELAISLQ